MSSKLTLYHYVGCPFCDRVWDAAERLGIVLEERNIFEDRTYREELVAARGRATVPVLRIDHEDGRVEWLPESMDIVRYLTRRSG